LRGARFGTAGRLALFPARAAARASREAAVPELSKLADSALASDLPEHVAQSIADHHVLERVAGELARTGALDAAVDKALASPKTSELMTRLVQSPEVKQAIKDVVGSREVRDALAEQSVGMAGELTSDIRTRSAELDDQVEARVRRWAHPGRSANAGVATRLVAFVVDLLAIAVIFAVVGGTLALISYLVGGLHPKWLVETLLGSGLALIALTYLVFFWSGAGRTPGMHLMHVRVHDRAGRPPSVPRSLVRAVVTWLSIVPLFLGFVTVLFDARRRGVPDLVAGTEVVYERR
jgi:uncharacterized RDD family membrane protein YckC